LSDPAPLPTTTSLVKQTGGTLLLRIAGLAVAFVGSVVLARILAPDAYGAYAYALSIVTLLALLPQVGIPILLIRETSRYWANGELARLRGLWSWSTRSILLISLTTAVLAGGLVLLLNDDLAASGPSTHALLAGLLLSPLLALSAARSAAMIGLQRILAAQLPDVLLRPILLMLFVLAAWWMGRSVGALDSMLLHVLAAALALAVGVVLLLRARPAQIREFDADHSGAQAWRRSSWMLGLVTGLQLISGEISIILVGLFRPEADAGVYKIALTVAALGGLGISTFAQVLSPYIAQLSANKADGRLQRVLAAGAWGSFMLTAPFLLLVVIAGRWFVKTVYGAPYAEAGAPLVVLAAAQLVTAYFGMTATTLSMTGHERSCVSWLALAALFNVVLCVLMLPAFGVMAAAFAQLGSAIIWNAGFLYVVRKKTGLDTRFSLRSDVRPREIWALVRGRW
jgi:O-antigen/teichoic acid export membrane protein